MGGDVLISFFRALLLIRHLQTDHRSRCEHLFNILLRIFLFRDILRLFEGKNLTSKGDGDVAAFIYRFFWIIIAGKVISGTEG